MRKVHRLEEIVFWHVFDRPSCLRNDLGQHFGISPATVSRVVSVLVEKGLVIETSAEVSSPGRKPQSLKVNPRLATLLGIDIHEEGALAVVTDLAGTLLGRGTVRCDAERGVDEIVSASLKAADAALEDAEIPRSQIRRLGVSHCGDLDIKNGICVSWANAPGWKFVPIRDMLASAFGMTVTIEDRARALATAERRISPEDWGHTESVYFTCGSGIGMGFFAEGRLYRGASQGGGEIGHTVIDASGPLCRCGNRGCVEAFAGIVAILDYVRKSLAAGAVSTLRDVPATDLNLRAVVNATRQGDAVASAALTRAARALGIAVANTVQLLNPSLVVLCGQLALLAGPEILEPVRLAVRSHCVETAARRVEIRLARPKKDVSAIGCALLAAEAEAERILRAKFTEE
ncbi:MAG: ROK family transcriptional regulator [Acidobacteriales bacterium]|nr:ROK family transcriptional regulator [Terriglobales bacterium]